MTLCTWYWVSLLPAVNTTLSKGLAEVMSRVTVPSIAEHRAAADLQPVQIGCIHGHFSLWWRTGSSRNKSEIHQGEACRFERLGITIGVLEGQSQLLQGTDDVLVRITGLYTPIPSASHCT